MSARLTFLRRTPKETEVSGGEVFFELDGKCLGTLAPTDCFVELPAGDYKLRMYKSHAYGSMIGFAEVHLTLRDGESLLVRYAPPMTVVQPGSIQLSDYSEAAADEASARTTQAIVQQQTDESRRTARRTHSNRVALTWIIIGSVLTAGSLAIVYLVIWLPLLL